VSETKDMLERMPQPQLRDDMEKVIWLLELEAESEDEETTTEC